MLSFAALLFFLTGARPDQVKVGPKIKPAKKKKSHVSFHSGHFPKVPKLPAKPLVWPPGLGLGPLGTLGLRSRLARVKIVRI